jgi:hypothetical protein
MSMLILNRGQILRLVLTIALAVTVVVIVAGCGHNSYFHKNACNTRVRCTRLMRWASQLRSASEPRLASGLRMD